VVPLTLYDAAVDQEGARSGGWAANPHVRPAEPAPKLSPRRSNKLCYELGCFDRAGRRPPQPGGRPAVCTSFIPLGHASRRLLPRRPRGAPTGRAVSLAGYLPPQKERRPSLDASPCHVETRARIPRESLVLHPENRRCNRSFEQVVTRVGSATSAESAKCDISADSLLEARHHRSVSGLQSRASRSAVGIRHRNQIRPLVCLRPKPHLSVRRFRVSATGQKVSSAFGPEYEIAISLSRDRNKKRRPPSGPFKQEHGSLGELCRNTLPPRCRHSPTLLTQVSE
jgi:hypothetical protein